MSSKISSLKNQKQFQIISSIGRKRSSSLMLSIFAHFSSPPPSLNNDAPFLLGMKVTKKLGNAVARNKIKRRVRHCFRELVREKLLAERSALIIIPRKDFLDASFSYILSQLRKTVTAGVKTNGTETRNYSGGRPSSARNSENI